MVLMGGTGLWVVNQIWKHDYDLRAHDAALLAGWVNGLENKRLIYNRGESSRSDPSGPGS
jgi:hypothetical protein